jgi:hypothetical protein
MQSDFVGYGHKEEDIHIIMSGKEKDGLDRYEIEIAGDRFILHGSERIKTLNRGIVYARELQENDDVDIKDIQRLKIY